MKKILAIILCITFLFSTVACGSEKPNDMETFDVSPRDFKSNLKTLLGPSGFNISDSDFTSDSAFDICCTYKNDSQTFVSLKCNDSDFPVKITVWYDDKFDSSYLFVVRAVLIIINADADPQDIMNDLDINSELKDNPTHSKEAVSFEGVRYSLESGFLVAKIDSENPKDYVKHPISDYTSQYPGTYAKNSPEDSSEKSSEIDSEISTEQPVQPDTEVAPSSETEISSEDDYQEMLSKYDALFSEQLYVIYHTLPTIESALAGEDVSASDLNDILSDISDAEGILSAYYNTFDKDHQSPPFGTKIMTLLSDARFALRRYYICVEHLYYYYDSIGDSSDLESAEKYYKKTNDTLSDYDTLLESEQNK